MPINDLAFQINDHDIINSHIVVRDPRWLDGHHAQAAINLGYIAPSQGNQTVPGQQQVGLQYRLF